MVLIFVLDIIDCESILFIKVRDFLSYSIFF